VSNGIAWSHVDDMKDERQAALPKVRSRYIIAMTPRSGSSYLCDVMGMTGRLGHPGEFLNPVFIPNMLKAVPARNGDEYLRRIMARRRTPNGVSGLKASWFHIQGFMSEMKDLDYLSGFRFIYLRRRDLAMQAVSLYKAAASGVFHTNVEHDEKRLGVLKDLEYDFDAIHKWYRHILSQEEGWDAFFYENRIFPLQIFYEDIERDVLRLMKRMAAFVAVNPDNVHMPEKASIFSKVRDRRNIEWAHRFARGLAERGEELPSVFGVG